MNIKYFCTGLIVLILNAGCTVLREKSTNIYYSYDAPNNLYLDGVKKSKPILSVNFTPNHFGYAVPWLYSYSFNKGLSDIHIGILKHNLFPESIYIDHIALDFGENRRNYTPDKVVILDGGIVYSRYHFSGINYPIREDGHFELIITLNDFSKPNGELIEIKLPVFYRIVTQKRRNVSIFDVD